MSIKVTHVGTHSRLSCRVLQVVGLGWKSNYKTCSLHLVTSTVKKLWWSDPCWWDAVIVHPHQHVWDHELGLEFLSIFGTAISLSNMLQGTMEGPYDDCSLFCLILFCYYVAIGENFKSKARKKIHNVAPIGGTLIKVKPTFQLWLHLVWMQKKMWWVGSSFNHTHSDNKG